MGVDTLVQLTTGDRNVAIGNGALSSLTTGNGNVAIGDGAGSGITSSSNKLYISSMAGSLIEGDFSSGNVSLGQTSGTVSVLNSFSVAGTASLQCQQLKNY